MIHNNFETLDFHDSMWNTNNYYFFLTTNFGRSDLHALPWFRFTYVHSRPGLKMSRQNVAQSPVKIAHLPHFRTVYTYYYIQRRINFLFSFTQPKPSRTTFVGCSCKTVKTIRIWWNLLTDDSYQYYYIVWFRSRLFFTVGNVNRLFKANNTIYPYNYRYIYYYIRMDVGISFISSWINWLFADIA